MPALSPTMTEGTLARWLKKEGDAIAAGDVIAEIETDKATMEVEAVDEGILGQILVADGTEGVKVNAPIGILVDAGEAVPDVRAPAALPRRLRQPGRPLSRSPGLPATRSRSSRRPAAATAAAAPAGGHDRRQRACSPRRWPAAWRGRRASISRH